MKSVGSTLVVNNASNAANQLAAALAEAKILSRYIRPYANMGRAWERALERLPGASRIYSRTFGRRIMPAPLSTEHVAEVAGVWNMALAMHARVPIQAAKYRGLRGKIIQRLEDSISEAGARALRHEKMVVSSWKCALRVFEVAKKRGIICVLNYPLAHHAYTRRYLMDEAEREPSFAATLNSHDLPQWKTDQMDREIELADHILVGSDFARNTFINEGVPAAKVEVISYGADISLFSPAPEKKEGRFGVLFAGQLSQRKGLSYLLRGYEQFCDTETSLTLVGQYQDDGSATRPWRHLFEHVPHVPRKQLAEIFRQSDVLVFPSLVEGMGLVVLEAMASGLPVIVTENGPGGLIQDGVQGFIVPTRDADAIASCLRRLRADPELSSRMAKSARDRAQLFTWAHYRSSAVERISNWLSQ